MPSLAAGFENLTNTRVSSGDQRLTVKLPPWEIRRWVTALLSTPMPTSTGSIDSWVIHEVVIPFHSSPLRDPTRARALGIFHVTLLTSSSLSSGMGASPSAARRGYRGPVPTRHP